MASSEKIKQGRLEQDIAAGGKNKRRLKINSGDIVTVSIELTDTANGYLVSMRFKSGGSFRKKIGITNERIRTRALAKAWEMLRESNLVTEHGWEWYEK